jgi:hypothetical protein
LREVRRSRFEVAGDGNKKVKGYSTSSLASTYLEESNCSLITVYCLME